jgi:N-acetylglucosaminyldiphosphoundecaprenol N-acetyl-beta-D-mannosaminyltransferase
MTKLPKNATAPTVPTIKSVTPILFQKILGIRFFTGSAGQAVLFGSQGGLIVVPAAPALLELQINESYREAVYNADLAITDSAFMVLLWWLFTGKKITRVSGLRYLKFLFESQVLNSNETVLWIMPSVFARDQNLAWLRSKGFTFSEADCYLAPQYPDGTIEDKELTELVAKRKPSHIVICLGGGTQERVGLMLKRGCDFRPAIHCIGAAIGFLSGNQVRIPMWADKVYLGWLFRCCSEPRKFIPRYLKAFQLVPLLARYGENSPKFFRGSAGASL